MLNDKYQDAFPLHKLPAQVAEQGPGLIEFVAMQCGGTFVSSDPGPAAPGSLCDLIGLLAHQSGHTVQVLVQDLNDMVWSPEERLAAIPGLRKLRLVVDTLLTEAEAGVKS
ncbi:MAG: hypothetical protein LLG93_10595 [Deltaproteobacteria bacterium]|nr:hypothetical protein [Deltaproteobacteria bacterium]